MQGLGCVILAAGEGKRMHSSLPKILHKLAGKPVINYVIELVMSLGMTRPVVVVGYGADKVREHLPSCVTAVLQKQLLGTADAVKTAMPLIDKKAKDIVILYADTPCLTADTFTKLISHHRAKRACATLLTAEFSDPSEYGRIERKNSRIFRILEKNQLLTLKQRAINEINSGVVCFNKNALFKFIGKVSPNIENGEYYLTDVIARMVKEGLRVESVQAQNPDEVIGINSRADLARGYKIIRDRLMTHHLSQGVTILDPDTTYIEHGVEIGQDTIIHPHTIIESGCAIGRDCSIGPFARLRSGVRIYDGVTVGNFVELVRTTLNEDTNVRHFSYLGDAKVGRAVNIGAGTITANYNGKSKNPTVIEDGSFVGSGSIFVAPVKVGKNAVTGAGSVVTKGSDVPNGATVVGVPARLLKKIVTTNQHE